MKDESESRSDETTGAARHEPNLEHENLPTDSRCTNDEDMIAKEVKSVVKDLVAKELSTMI